MKGIPGFRAELGLSRSRRSYRSNATARTTPVVAAAGNGAHLIDVARHRWTGTLLMTCEARYQDCLERCGEFRPTLTTGGGQWGEGLVDEQFGGVVGGNYPAVCRLRCAHLFDCGDDRQCVSGYCCDKDRVCGSACCDAGELCLSPSKCCPTDRVCGTTCCSSPGRCTREGCCPPGRLVCGDRCCGSGELCSPEGCCPADRLTDDGHCCGVGTAACGTTCCGSDTICTAEGCCPKGTCCSFQGECPPGTSCCGGQICCKAGLECRQVYGTGHYGCFS